MRADSLGVTERLTSLRLPIGAPLLVLHGRGVTDRFVSRDFRISTLEQVLWALLRGGGFTRVVFSHPQWPVYFLDSDSRDMSRRSPRAAPGRPRRMRHFTGPLGAEVLTRRGGDPRQDSSGEVAPGEHLRPGRTGLSDEHAVSLLSTYLGSTSERTAVIFIDAEQWLRHTAAARSFALAVAGALENPINANLCVMVFRHNTIAEVRAFVQGLGQYPGLETHLAHLDGSVASTFAIDHPQPAELGRLVQLTRLRAGLPIEDWGALGAVVRDMASARVPLREWEGRLGELAQEGTALSGVVLRQRAWVSTALPGGGSVWDRLAAMPGLASVKQHLERLRSRLVADAALRAQGRARFTQPTALHLVFTGNPGTGKTTVAGLVGEMYRDLGLLTSGHVVEAKGSDLIAGFVGQTTDAVRQAVERARGGVLLIDEAYQLSDQLDGFGRDAINTLVQLMDAEREHLVVIAAGYPDKMSEFLASNPGLPSRFPEANVIDFPDYEPEELLRILLAMLADHGVSWSAQLEEQLRGVTSGMHAGRRHDFGNARTMRNLAHELFTEWAHRVGAAVDQPLGPEDLPARYRTYLPDRALPSADEVLAELDSLVGLSEVKELIRGLLERLRLDQRRAAAGLRTAGVVAPHLLFVGPPGTGKTTVARLMGRLFQAIGLLRKRHVREVSHSDLVAEYLGQTAPMTKRAVYSALDGVLFIDEAYSLTPTEDTRYTDYGREAIATLIKEMEDARGRLVVIAAGYSDKMDKFLASNPGLHSRFTERVEFPNYSVPELVEILRRSAAHEDFSLTEGAAQRAAVWLSAQRQRHGNRFGNARAVRGLLDEIKRRLARRVLAAESGAEALRTIEPEDVPDVQP